MIDWPTVFFQVLNFLAIMWILRKYLFAPVMGAMDRREREIHDRLKTAEKLKRETADEKRALEAELIALDKRRSRIIADARNDAELEGAALVRSLDAEVQARRDEELRELEFERAELMKSVADIAGRAVIDTANAALKGLANANVERALVDNFSARANPKNIGRVPDLKRYYGKTGLMLVNSSFEMDAASRRKVRRAVSKLVGRPARVKFGLDDGIACGLEIVCDSLVISYGLDGYIEELRRTLDDGIAAATRTAPRKKRK